MRSSRAATPADQPGRSAGCWCRVRRRPDALLVAADECPRRGLHPLGRAHAVPGPRPGRGDGHPPHPAAALVVARRRPRRAGLAGSLLQWWTNAVDYPFLISGKPLFSLPATIPVTFELTILLSALAAPSSACWPERPARSSTTRCSAAGASGGPRTTASSSASRRPTRASTGHDPRSSSSRSAASRVEEVEA